MIVLITQGDPQGIGPEIIIKALKKIDKEKRKKIIIIGDINFFTKAGWTDKLCNIIPITSPYNDKDKHSAFVSFKSVDVALKLIKRKWATALVTAPISKEKWIKYDIKYNGHTDYFRKTLHREPLMCFKKGNIITALLTEHIPLKKVSLYVKKEKIIEKSQMLEGFIKKLGIKNPRIAIVCLNPHSGEKGKIGKEEIEEIIPAIVYLKRKGKSIVGPVNPDDGIKMNIQKKIDGCLFMYHDQLLPLLKMIEPHKNDIVHITWGLGFVRTSPTHGTAYDIAWKNLGDETSMLYAINTVFEIL